MNYTSTDRNMAQLLVNCLRDKFNPEEKHILQEWALSILRSPRGVTPLSKGPER